MYPHRAFKRIFKHDKAQAPAGSSTFSGLDTAKIVLQATANLGDGALTVPGLKAAAQLALQIIDIAKVRVKYIITVHNVTPFLAVDRK